MYVQVPEWSKGVDCKSIIHRFESDPVLFIFGTTFMTPTETYRFLRDNDPDKLTPDVVKQLREKAAAAGEDELNGLLREIIGQPVTPKPSKNLLFG